MMNIAIGIWRILMATWAVSEVRTAKYTKNKFLKDKQKRLHEKIFFLDTDTNMHKETTYIMKNTAIIQ